LFTSPHFRFRLFGLPLPQVDRPSAFGAGYLQDGLLLVSFAFFGLHRR
jgi:hypothetical protein